MTTEIWKNAASPDDAYSQTANVLVQRILETFEKHPEAAEITDAWKLLKVKGFDCSDLEPSLFQADWALAHARRIWRETHP
jgi:hypothetical protein